MNRTENSPPRNPPHRSRARSRRGWAILVVAVLLLLAAGWAFLAVDGEDPSRFPAFVYWVVVTLYALALAALAGAVVWRMLRALHSRRRSPTGPSA